MSNPKKETPTGDGNPAAGSGKQQASIIPSHKALASDLHRVGRGYSVRFELKDGNHLQATWHPDLPPKKVMRAIWESGRCHVARHRFCEDLAQKGGISLLVLDI